MLKNLGQQSHPPWGHPNPISGNLGTSYNPHGASKVYPGFSWGHVRPSWSLLHAISATRDFITRKGFSERCCGLALWGHLKPILSPLETTLGLLGTFFKALLHPVAVSTWKAFPGDLVAISPSRGSCKHLSTLRSCQAHFAPSRNHQGTCRSLLQAILAPCDCSTLKGLSR